MGRSRTRSQPRTSAVLALFVRPVFASLRRRARRLRGVARGQCGAVTFVLPGARPFRVALLEPGSAGRILWRREFRAQCPVTARTQDALVAAWNECLQETLRRLEEDLRAALPRVVSPDPRDDLGRGLGEQ